MRFDAVSFDCWGTLLVDFDWQRTYGTRVSLLAEAVRPYREITNEAARMALDDSWRRHYAHWESGHPSGAHEMAREAIRFALDDSIAGVELRDAASALALAFSNATLEADIRPVPGSALLLESLQRSGVRLGMICDTGFATGTTVRVLLDRAGLLQWLTTQIFSDEWGVPKPHPRLFWAALADLEVDPDRAAHVGDLDRTDVRGARAAGMAAIRLTAHYDDPSASDAADFVVRSHEALRALLLPAPRVAIDPESVAVEASADAGPPRAADDVAFARRVAAQADSTGIEFVEDAVSLWRASAGDFVWVPRPWAASEREAQHAQARRSLDAALPALREALRVVEFDADAGVRRAPDETSEPPLLGLSGARPDRDQRLDERIRSGALPADWMKGVARALSTLHDGAPRSQGISYRATAEKLASEIRRLGSLLRDSRMETRVFESCEEALLGFVLQRSDVLRSRVAGEHIRQIHGDLRTDSVFVEDSGEVWLLPPLHFAAAAATADPCLDVASLALGLPGPDAEAFATAYAESSLDFECLALFDFYRRFGALRSAAKAAFSLGRVRHAASRRLHLAALVAAERAIAQVAPPPGPRVVAATGGKVGTGKSTISRMARDILRAPRIEVDELSARLIDEPPAEPLRQPLPSPADRSPPPHEADWERRFAAGFREGVYAEVFRQARAVLGSGRSVVLDGCFGTRLARQEAQRLAREHGARFLFLECELDPEVHRERLRTRERERETSSGTWDELASEFARTWQDVTELRPTEHLRIDTQQSLDFTRDLLESHLRQESADAVER